MRVSRLAPLIAAQAGGFGPDLQVNKGTAGGATGSPGTLPTNWAASTPSNGISRQILAVHGDSIEARFSGTASGTSFQVISQFALPFAAQPAESYRIDFAPPQVVAGVLPGAISFQTLWFLALSFVGAQGVQVPVTSFTLPAGVDNFRNQISIAATVGQAVDVTLRIAAPRAVRRVLR